MASDLSIMSLLPTLLKTVPSIIGGIKGENLGPQTQTTSDINQIAKAETNTSNPLYQSLLSQNKQAGNQQLAGTIAQLQAQNRLAQSSGQKPLLDQERGGESIFRNLIQGQEDVGNQAIGQTYGQLNNAQSALKGSLGAQQNLAQNQFANTKSAATGYASLGDALQGMFGLGQNKQPQAQANNKTNQNSYNMAPQYNAYPQAQPQQTGQYAGQNQLLNQNFGYVSNG